MLICHNYIYKTTKSKCAKMCYVGPEVRESLGLQTRLVLESNLEVIELEKGKDRI